ncbi:MAG: IS5 family transposase [Burkholderiaceae bacterium]|nr:IS5 family transposase [Burkholderiaceae bacterium]
MPIDRYIITDRQWGKIEPHCLGKKSDPGRTGGDARLFLEAVFWIARTGAQWRDLPGEFGKWNSVYRRFRDWGIAGVFERIFNALSEEPDMEMAMIDGTIVKVHRHGQGSKGGPQSQAIGKSKGGWTTKILALTDALGNLVRFVLLPGHRFDTVGVAPLIDGISFDAMLADKAFDSNWIIAEMNARGALICISQHPRRCKPLAIDPDIYKCRHLIENFFCKLKEFKRISMRADKTDTYFKAMIYAVAALINSR